MTKLNIERIKQELKADWLISSYKDILKIELIKNKTATNVFLKDNKLIYGELQFNTGEPKGMEPLFFFKK